MYAVADKEEMVFDWELAARLILKHKAQEAWAGLEGDWENTAGRILIEGLPDKKSYTYLASVWAMPCVVIGEMKLPCYRLKHHCPGWDAKTKWPESALEIVKKGGEGK